MGASTSKLSEKMKTIFRDKPELVINFPEWMLSDEMIDVYRRMERLAIVEIAGRDSVAAAIQAVKNNGFMDLLPTYAYTGTEHGPWSNVEQALERLCDGLSNVRVHGLVVLGSPLFWQAMNGRFISEFMVKFRFYTPCIGCHLYLHAVRIPLARFLGGVPIIAGERERHNGSVKISQIPEAIDCYTSFTEKFGIDLLLPLRHIADGRAIKEIIGLDWRQDKEQLKCSLAGNYRLNNGQIGVEAMGAVRFLEEFALEFTGRIVSSYLKGQIPDHMSVAAGILRSI
jgi:hypothetical protein